MKKALITGITGQDGSYLAELLIVKGYDKENELCAETKLLTYVRNWPRSGKDEN